MKPPNLSPRRRAVMISCIILTWSTGLLLCPPAMGEKTRLVTLRQAYSLALGSHPSMTVLRERVSRAEAVRYRAWSALKPTATIKATFTHYDSEISFQVADTSTTPPRLDEYVLQKQNQFGWQAAANLPLFRGPAYSGIGVARKKVELARLNMIRSRQDFMLRIASEYYEVVSLKEVVQALENKVALDAKHLAAARARFEVGQSARSLVSRAELVLTQSRQRLRAEQNNLGAARRKLAILLGLRGQADVRRPPEPADVRVTDDRRLSAALERRRDYQAAGLSVKMARQSRRAAWWGFAPALDLTWLYRWSESEDFAGNQGSWNLMLGLTVPLYDGGVRYADLREARARVREARGARQVLARKIEGQIVDLKARLESANAGVISARKAVSLAKITASDMEASFQAGAATQLDVLDASQRQLDAELTLTRGLYSRELARLSMAHALGMFDPVGRAR